MALLGTRVLDEVGRLNFCKSLIINGARGGTRTHTPLLAKDFKSLIIYIVVTKTTVYSLH